MGFVGKQTKVALALALVALATDVNLDWRLVDLFHLHVGIFSTMLSIYRCIASKNITSWLAKNDMNTSAMNILEVVLLEIRLIVGNKKPAVRFSSHQNHHRKDFVTACYAMIRLSAMGWVVQTLI